MFFSFHPLLKQSISSLYTPIISLPGNLAIDDFVAFRDSCSKNKEKNRRMKKKD